MAREEVTLAYEQIGMAPGTTAMNVREYLRRIAQLHQERDHLLEDPPSVAELNRQLDEIDTKLSYPHKHLDVITGLGPGFDKSIVSAALLFGSSLNAAESHDIYGENPDERTILRKTMHLVVLPSLAHCIGVGEDLADAPRAEWAAVAKAFKNSNTPYGDAIDQGFEIKPPQAPLIGL